MLNIKIEEEGVSFSVNERGKDLDFEDWASADAVIYYMPLITLVDNGNAVAKHKECFVPFSSLYLLDEDDREVLGLPESYDKAMRLHGEGMLNSSDFKYKLELLTHVPDGDILGYERAGNIISVRKDKKYLLNDFQYKLFMMVDGFNRKSPEDKTPDRNFREFATIKELALMSNCELDSYLDNENVYVPEKVKLDVEPEGDGFKIEPTVDIEDHDKFTRNFDRMRKVQNVYPVQREDGSRVRVVINDKQKENLKPLKARKSLFEDSDEVREVISNPTEYFDPDQFDLSEFYSDRVIEIGAYKPKFYPFISPYKSCWVAGANVETPENGTTKITLDSMDAVNDLRDAIADAEGKGQKTCFYDDTQIDLDDAKALADLATQQLSNPNKPVRVPNDSNGNKVLIIEENAEEVGFSVKEKGIEEENKYTLYTDTFLREGYTLKSHQQEGVAWLQYLWKNKASGCLLADDMGLGKTLQILYFIDWHSRMNPDHKPYLIVAPISLLENWENEYARFFSEPRLKVTRLTSKDVPRKFNKDTIDWMQSMDIILTNYESLRISQLNFCAVQFDVVVLDEAQKIKTPGTLVTNAAKALKSNFKVAMTGTPVENTLLDLWCIMDFCVPGLLGNAKAFAAKYQSPLKSEDTDLVALGKEIHDKLGIHFMRRLKSDVAKDLPMKYEVKEKVAMPDVQEQTYDNVIKEYMAGVQPNMLLTILGIREVSEHPYLHTDDLFDHTDKELIESSARLQATVKFLDKIKEKNEKVIIFAERKDTQKMLQRVVYDRYGLIPSIINGDTPTLSNGRNNKESRQQTIDRFQASLGFNVIIMSPIAAGMGLNVTAANNVIHYGRHWNPAKENQATDRAYRIGQTKDVYVYYPMAISKKYHSFDITLDELLNRKLSLATSTLFPTDRIEVKPDEMGRMLFEV